jgi:uncharacterized lipoprotein
MKKIYLLTIALFTLTSLSGCWPMGGNKGLIHNRENNYLKSTSEPNLTIPAPLSRTEINTDHAIPEVTNTTPPTAPVSIAPPGSILNPVKS